MSTRDMETTVNKPSISISDNHLLVAQGLALALGRHYKIKGILRDGHELEALIRTDPPDAIVTEVLLMGQSGLDTLERIRSTNIKVPFVIFTSQLDPLTLHRAIYAGARGVVAKVEGVATLQAAIGTVLQGSAYVSDAFLPALVCDSKFDETRLTKRQHRVLELLDQGMTAQQMGELLGLSRRTIESHKTRLLRILGAHSLLDLLAKARSHSLLGPAKRSSLDVLKALNSVR